MVSGSALGGDDDDAAGSMPFCKPPFCSGTLNTVLPSLSAAATVVGGKWETFLPASSALSSASRVDSRRIPSLSYTVPFGPSVRLALGAASAENKSSGF